MGLEYIVDLGKKSRNKFPNKYKTEENFIHGCTSNAWIKLENKDPIQINTISDSMIVSGILYLLEEAFNGEPKSSIDNYSGHINSNDFILLLTTIKSLLISLMFLVKISKPVILRKASKILFVLSSCVFKMSCSF